MKNFLFILSLLLFFLTLTQLNGTLEVFASSNTSVFDTIEAPQGVAQLNKDGGGIGIMLFISNMIKLASIVAGVWVLFNFIFAGFTYITSNDSSAYAKIGEKLSMSVTGLLLIVASYTIIGIISMIIFGSPTYIINPEIPTAISTPTP